MTLPVLALVLWKRRFGSPFVLFFFNCFLPWRREISVVLNTVMWCTWWYFNGITLKTSISYWGFAVKEAELPSGFGSLAGQSLGRRGCVMDRRVTEGWEGTRAVDPPACPCKGCSSCHFHNPLQGGNAGAHWGWLGSVTLTQGGGEPGRWSRTVVREAGVYNAFFLLTRTWKIGIIATSILPLLRYPWYPKWGRWCANRTKVVRCLYGEGKGKIWTSVRAKS